LTLSVKAEGAFSYYRAITVDHAKVPSTQSNFPVLVATTTADLATTGNGGDVTDAQGDDIGFYTNTDCSTGKMDWEVELYTATTGRVVYWVRVASLASGTDTVFYMCYANSAITTDQSNKTGVWNSDYKGVWHLPNGTSLTALDSTSGGYNGTITNATVSAGAIDGGATFNGSNATISFGDVNEIESITRMTVCVWLKPSDVTSTYQHFISKTSDDATTGWSFQTSGPYFNSGAALMIVYGTGTGASVDYTTADYLANGVWIYACAVFDGTLTGDANRAKIYTNGVQRSLTHFSGGASVPNTLNSNAVNLELANPVGTGDSWYYGVADEPRVTASALTADWIAAEYSNQSNPDAFFSCGAETSVGGGSPAPAPTYRRVIITE
jgi:hypothetical protein